MSFQTGQWMNNYSDDGIWSSGGYFNTKEEAIEDGKHEFNGDYDLFYVGQIAPVKLRYKIDTEHILERIAESVYDETGEVSEDYLRDVKKEHDKLLEDRLNKVLYEWMDEFNYNPNFFKIVNVETIILNEEEFS